MADPTYREHLAARLSGFLVPPHLHEGLIEYLAARRPTGAFLRAVLSNDLKESVSRADMRSLNGLWPLVYFLCNVAPAPAWGSPAHVAAWLADPEPVPEIFE